MSHDWLLVETLGAEPAVVARGRQLKNLVPISTLLRRSPHLMAVQAAIGETVRAGQGLSSITPKNDQVIRTEVVTMTDGRIHGVHVWIGPPDEEPPERPIPGTLKWNLTTGVVIDTAESLYNAGRDPAAEPNLTRVFGDLTDRDVNPSDAQVLALVVDPEAGKTFISTWDVTDYRGEAITVGFVARALLETPDDDGDDGRAGGEQLICRAMNWRAAQEGTAAAVQQLAQQILNEPAPDGAHRVLVDIDNWKLLTWLDEPPSFFDWRARGRGDQVVHPDDAREMARMTIEFTDGSTAGVLRLRGPDDGWTTVALTVRRVELDDGVYAGLVTLRLPSADELAGLPDGSARA